MKVPLKIVIVVGLLLAASASWATISDYLPDGVTLKLKFANFDVGTMYPITSTWAWVDDDGNPNTPPVLQNHPYTSEAAINAILGQEAPQKGLAGEDSWGILVLTDVYDASGAGTDLLWRQLDPAYGNTQVCGIYWGGADSYLSAYTDPYGNVTQSIGASGFQLALWEDDPTALGYTAFDATQGPNVRTNPSGAYYPTVSDGTLIWTFDSVPGYTRSWDGSETRDFLADYTVASDGKTISGSGGFWGSVSETNPYGVGVLNGLIQKGGTNILGHSGDIMVNFTNHTPAYKDANGNPILPINRWDVYSDDPAYTTTTPELSTSALMLVGLLPIGMMWRRRKRG